MSAESREIFDRELTRYAAAAAAAEASGAPAPDAGPLRAAAAQHAGCSRSLDELTGEYGRAMEGRPNHSREQSAAAQLIADELAAVRAAAEIAAGRLPGTGY